MNLRNKKSLYVYIFTLIVLPCVVFILGLWTENDSSSFYNKYIKRFVTFEVPIFGISIITIIIIGAIFYLILQLVINKMNDEINIINTELEHQKKSNESLSHQLDDNARIMWRNYKQLMGIKNREVFYDVIEHFSKSNKYILGVQLYSYDEKIRDGETVIKINYNEGYISEDIDLNGMIQCYYTVNTDIYKDFFDYVLKFKESNIDIKIDMIGKFIKKYLNSLIEKKQKYNDKDANKFALILLAIQILYSSVNTNKNILVLGKENIHKETQLYEFRTGILRGIMYGSFYMFMHNNNKHKQNRFYVSIPMTFQDIKSIMIITLNNLVLNEPEGIKIVENLSNDLVFKLDIEINKKYNKSKEVL